MTAERVAQLHKLFDEGLSYADIGKQMGLRKNQVAGALSRHYPERRFRVDAERVRAWRIARKRGRQVI